MLPGGNGKENRSGRWRPYLAAFTGAAIVMLLLAGSRLPPTLYLEVAQSETAKVVLRITVNQGDDFTIWFFHSYDRAYFEEHYRILDAGRILLTHMTFKSSLNGQGYTAGTYRTRPDGSAELVGINRMMGQVDFRLGSADLANHTLIIHGRRIGLLDFAEAGDLLTISIRAD